MAALVALSLIASACGSDDDKATSTTAGGTATSSAGTATTTAGGDTTVAGTQTTAENTDETTGGGSSDDALIIARGMDVNSLDPSLAYCDTCQIFLTAVYETLIGLDDDNKTQVPRLATEWEGNDDQTEFTLQWSEDSVVLDAGPRGREILLRDAGGLTPQQTVYTNANLRAEFGLGASGRDAILRYLPARQVANCVKD